MAKFIYHHYSMFRHASVNLSEDIAMHAVMHVVSYIKHSNKITAGMP